MMSIRLIVSLSAVALALTNPAAAQVAPAFQPIRPGDNALTCEALMSEMTALSTQVQSASARMQARALSMVDQAETAREQNRPSAAATLGGLAASFVPGAGLVLGAAQALSAAAPTSAAVGPDLRGQIADTAAMQNVIPVAQRIEHLSAIWRTKQCS